MLAKLQKNILSRRFLTVGSLLVLILVAALLVSNNKSSTPGGPYPYNGNHRIVRINDVTCSLSSPPQCAGSLTLSPGQTTTFQAQIDQDTKVRYRAKEIQIYPNHLKEGMTGEVTFKPSSSVIDTMVIDD